MAKIKISTKLKKILVGLAAGTIAVTTIASLPAGKVQICTAQQCYILTATEYRNLKIALLEKAESRTPMSWEEFNILTKIYDYEIKKNGSIPLLNKGRIEVANAQLDQRLLDRITQVILAKSK
jgi:hypothetical protein